MPDPEFIAALAIVVSGFGGVIKKLFNHETRMSRIEGKIDTLLEHNGIDPPGDDTKEARRKKR